MSEVRYLFHYLHLLYGWPSTKAPAKIIGEGSLERKKIKIEVPVMKTG